MRVLIACERSGVVREAFRARGHKAYSADIAPARDGSPYHLLGDVLARLADGWDLLIAHPECRYLTSSGLHWNHRRPGRAALSEAALLFVRQLMEAPILRIAVENPVGRIGTAIRPADQYVQPYEFGDDASKRTGLWLQGLPKLVPPAGARVNGRMVTWAGRQVERWANQTDSGQNRLGPSDDRAELRARTYPGIAAAMAAQWGI